MPNYLSLISERSYSFNAVFALRSSWTVIILWALNVVKQNGGRGTAYCTILVGILYKLKEKKEEEKAKQEGEHRRVRKKKRKDKMKVEKGKVKKCG